MKPVYKEKVITYLEGIDNSNKVLKEMLEGKRPSNQQDAIKLTQKIERLLELTRVLVD
jgi:hypothetical protein|tara:strand:+ start:1623 stop:1796 length:174 start_codon:yes stop_codon:yes gene_type:complete